MRFVLQPWQLFFLILAGWVNREQQAVIEFQNAQIRILMERMGLTSLENKIIDPGVEVGLKEGDIRCRIRLGGLLRYYYREAA